MSNVAFFPQNPQRLSELYWIPKDRVVLMTKFLVIIARTKSTKTAKCCSKKSTKFSFLKDWTKTQDFYRFNKLENLLISINESSTLIKITKTIKSHKRCYRWNFSQKVVWNAKKKRFSDNLLISRTRDRYYSFFHFVINGKVRNIK